MQKLSGKSLLLVSFTLFSMFFGAGQPDLPAASGRTGRYQPLACLCGPCRQRRRPAHCGRGGCGTGRRSGQACRPGASGVRHGVHHSGVSFHRALPCHPPHRQYLLPDAGAADRRRYRAAAGLLGSCFLQRPFWWRCGRKSLPTGWAASSAPA